VDSEKKWKRRYKVKAALGKTDRAALWVVTQEIGLNPALWARFLAGPIAPEMQQEMQGWSFEDWINYLKAKALELLAGAQERQEAVPDDIPLARQISEEQLELIANTLPEQPWPTGTHKIVAQQLNLPARTVTDAIQELIKRGRFSHQVDGVLLRPFASQENALSGNEKTTPGSD
jgi:hypothetical protein